MDDGYEQLLRLLQKASLDFATLSEWLLLPENRHALNAVSQLRPVTRIALQQQLAEAVKRHRAMSSPGSEDIEPQLQSHTVYRIAVKKQTPYLVFVHCLKQLCLDQLAMADLLMRLEATVGVKCCDAEEDTIAIALTGQLSMGNVVVAISHVLCSYLGALRYVIEINVE